MSELITVEEARKVLERAEADTPVGCLDCDCGICRRDVTIKALAAAYIACAVASAGMEKMLRLARKPIGVADSYVEDMDLPVGLAKHAEQCFAILPIIDAALAGTETVVSERELRLVEKAKYLLAVLPKSAPLIERVGPACEELRAAIAEAEGANHGQR